MSQDTRYYVDEIRAPKRSIPRNWLNFFIYMTLVYGLLLTVLLPWTIYDTFSQGWLGLGWSFVLASFGAMIMIRWCIVQFLAFTEHDRLRYRPAETSAEPVPFVSILVPAHNESETIVFAIDSLLSLDYPAYEIIIIDDGSSDDTYLQASSKAGEYGHCSVAVYRKANGGKSSALNYAFRLSAGEYVLCVDADSRLERTALKLLVRRLLQPGVVAVCGQVSISNRINLLTRLQALEYLMGNGGLRTALSTLGLVTVVPGPIGLYRRDALDTVAELPLSPSSGASHNEARGPLSPATFAEDFQLSLSALALGGRIVYEPRAKALTKCPERIDTLLSQRYRWMRGTWQVFHIYLRSLRAVSRRREKRLDYLMLALYPVDIYIAPPLNFAFWAFLAGAAANGFSLSLILSWLSAIAVLNVMTATIYIVAHDEDFTLLPLIPLLDLYQNLLVNSAWVIAIIDEIRGARMKW